MRDDDHFDVQDVYPVTRTSRVLAMLRTGGAAVVTVVALAAVVTWAYRLGMRDAQDVPVIRAMVEDMRIAPEDPGGLQVAHQDRRIYDVITDDAPREEPATALAPPPEPLVDEDVAMGQLLREAAPVRTEAPFAEGDRQIEAQSPAAPRDPVETVAPSDGLATQSDAIASIDDLVREVLGVSGAIADGMPSPRPRVRPVLVSTGPAQTRPRPTAPQPAIQLGAYQTRDVALQMWRSLSARNGDLLAGRDPVVNELAGSSPPLYGLRAVPFATTAEARGLCAALRARDEDCLVTQVR